MSTPFWQQNTAYVLGDLVQPQTVPGNVQQPFPNNDFEAGGANWSFVGGNVASGAENAWEGTQFAELNPIALEDRIGWVESDPLPVDAGRTFTVSAYFNPNSSGDIQGTLKVLFFDGSDNALAIAQSDPVVSPGSGSLETVGYTKITLQVTAPLDTSYIVVRGESKHGVTNTVSLWDLFEWNYTTQADGAPVGFIYECTTAGTSAFAEPMWPTTVDETVADNTVVWTARAADTVTWQARALTKSGDTEPSWPKVPGEVIRDGNMLWRCQSQAITDPNCPQTKEVAIGASKIFAGDNDVTRFSATLNPRDWTSEQDAGFLPTGLQQKGQVGVSAMGIYRGNLVVWSESNVQVWQIDPDPIAMALLDSMEGVGSGYQRAAQPVSNDLFFLAALGVRTVGIAVGAENLATGDAGLPIDILVQREVVPGIEPQAMYYPSLGQYWLAFPEATDGRPGRPPQFPDEELFDLFFSTLQYPIEDVHALDEENGYKTSWIIGLSLPLIDEQNEYLSGNLVQVVDYKDGFFTPELDEVNTYIDGQLIQVVDYKDGQFSGQLDESQLFLSADLVVTVSYLQYTDDATLIDETNSFLSGTLITI